MTEPTYEVNYEQLSQLSIADLVALENRFITTGLKKKSIYDIEAIATANELAGIFASELDKRINNIIIF